MAKYSFEFKKQIVLEYLSRGGGSNFLAKKYLPINLILFDQTNKKVQKELRKYPMIKNIQENLENINKEKK